MTDLQPPPSSPPPVSALGASTSFGPARAAPERGGTLRVSVDQAVASSIHC